MNDYLKTTGLVLGVAACSKDHQAGQDQSYEK